MNINQIELKKEETAVYALRQLYRQHGYLHYRMGKFEEYELYARNKSFLLSDRILTFTDTDGRLMAMKPDVTLSIVKNYAGEPLQKLCYNETVFRPDDSGFRQIEQTGLECIGQVDDFTQCEVVMLACRSLAFISPRYLLDISHMGFVSELVELAQPDEGLRAPLIQAIGQKNVPAIESCCRQWGIDESLSSALICAATLYAPAEQALSTMRTMVRSPRMQEACDELERTVQGVLRFDPQAQLRVDLSLVNDLHYYNGVIFRGFIEGIPSAVLSGGRYDNLLARMGKPQKAIGFGLYLSLLERFGKQAEEYDVDVLVTYDEKESVADVIAAVNALRAQGMSVRAQKTGDGVRCRRIARVRKGVYEFLEQND